MKKLVFILISMLILAGLQVYGESNSPLIKITLLNQDPDPARAGDTVSLRFKVENTGGQAVKNMDIELVQEYPFTAADNPAKKIDSLGAYQSGNNYVNLEFNVKIDREVMQGEKELKVRYRYSGNDWTVLTYGINIMNQEFAQIIYVDKAKLEPGKETDVKFTITNTGNAPLQNLIFTWQEPNGVILPVYSSDTKYVKYLSIGGSVNLDYKVIADINAKPGLYQLNLILKSESVANTTANVFQTKAGIFIGGETTFDVAFSESSQGQTSLSVSNTGNNPAQSVSVKIPNQESFRVMGSNSAIIGNLDKGDYTLVSFQIVPSGVFNSTSGDQRGQQQQADIGRQLQGRDRQNQDNNLKVVIDYTDTTGERQSVEKTVPIQFRSAGSSGTTNGYSGYSGRQQSSGSIMSTMWVWILVALVVIVGVVFFSKTGRERIANAFRRR